jgi:3-oxoacyl-[acyl-carrier protein] reductase
MDLGLNGKRAFILGSTQGIGRAVAESLITEGARVAINGRDREKGEAIAKEIGAELFIPGDLSTPENLASMSEQFLKCFEGIDIFVANTGGPKKGSIEQIDLPQWQADYQSLWLSPLELLQSFIPKMKEQNFGRIFFITSIAAKSPLKDLTTSNGLRAGLDGLVRSISLDLAQYGITANTLLPGYTNTERLQQLNLSEDKVKSLVPCGRLGQPQELADLLCFLSGQRASYITGQSIAIDGGAMI